MAYKDSECVGRIMGIIHEPWNEIYNKRYVRFFQLDYTDSIEVGYALINAIGSWVKKI
jgi:hypothetical protein